ncbi:MAG TPA: hypothetical protein VIX89_18245 [Bryobacteraceae bacterium]
MNENEQELLNALRGLAADGPRQAPPHVEEFLVAELRRRSHARHVRHGRIWWSVSAVAAIAAGMAVLMWMRPAPAKSTFAVARVSVPELSRPVETVVVPAVQKSQAIRSARVRPVKAAVSFYALPSASELPPAENAVVVRVQLPMSSLRLMGLLVSEESSAERIQADVLVGQDGLARGVRFVQ